jgi:hypothetical protein
MQTQTHAAQISKFMRAVSQITAHHLVLLKREQIYVRRPHFAAGSSVVAPKRTESNARARA